MNLKLVGTALGAAALWLSCSSDAAKKSIAIEVPQGFVRADGRTGAQIRATLKNAKPEDYQLSFATDLEGSSFAPIDDPADAPAAGETIDGNLVGGAATVSLYSVRTGPAKVQVTYEDPETGDTLSAFATVTFGQALASVASIEYVGASPEFVSLAGSGRDTATVTFIVKDSQGQPVADAPVVFILQNIGGATLDPTSGTTGADGKVSTTLKGGNIPGQVAITAVSGTIQTQSDPITVAGANVAGENFTFACEHYSIGGFQYWGLTMPCTVYVGDRNNMFKENTSITFLAEAGGIPKTKVTEEDSQSGRGQAQVVYQTQCKLPLDVPPDGTASDLGSPCDFHNTCLQPPVTQQRMCNPRDGLVTLVAVTIGSEALTFDANSNHKYDEGDQYTDQPEPFVDANDDGTWNPGEAFHDANNNQEWDRENGQWDEITAIWQQLKITWTGGPDPDRSSITPVAHQMLDDGTVFSYSVRLRDFNGNRPTSTSADDVIVADCGLTGCEGSETPYGDDAAIIDSAIGDGDVCTPTAADAGEPPSCTAHDYRVDFRVRRTLDIAPDDGSSHSEVVEIDYLNYREGTYE